MFDRAVLRFVVTVAIGPAYGKQACNLGPILIREPDRVTSGEVPKMFGSARARNWQDMIALIQNPGGVPDAEATLMQVL